MTEVAEVTGTLLPSFLSACKPRLVMGIFLSSSLVATINSQREQAGKSKKEHQLKTAVAISWHPIRYLLHTEQKQNGFPGKIRSNSSRLQLLQKALTLVKKKKKILELLSFMV